MLTCWQLADMAAQVDSLSRDTTASEDIIIDADRLVVLTSGDTVTQLVYGDVRAYHQGSFMYSDSARRTDGIFTAMSNVVMLQGDSIRLFADSLRYEIDTSVAYLYDNVALKHLDQELYTDRLVYNSATQIAYYYDTAVLVQQNSTVRSLKGVFDIDNEISYYYHYVTVEDGDFTLRSDSLIWYNRSKRATFNSPTRISTSDSEIYCEKGFYDLNDSTGLFKINAQYVGAETTALADSIYYDGASGLIELMGNAEYYNQGDTATADYIKYNQSTGDVLLRGSAIYQGIQRSAEGDVIRYNEISEGFETEGRSNLVDAERAVIADRLTYDKARGSGRAIGDVDYRDTINKARILADSLDFRDADEYVLATALVGKPVYSQLMDADSIHISADTLRSMTTVDTSFKILAADTLQLVTDRLVTDSLGVDSTIVIKTDSIVYDTIMVVDTSNYIIADNDVEIYRVDLQAVGDSLAYDRRDSTIFLFGSPVLWSDTTQFNADTIAIYMRDEAIDRIELINNAMIISSTDMVYYSQIAGRKIDAFFVDGELDSMVVSGNAQSIYYMEDEEDGYIGINKTSCARIVFLFDASELSDIKFYNDNESKILPIQGTDHEGLKLDGFSWQLARRPESSTDLKS